MTTTQKSAKIPAVTVSPRAGRKHCVRHVQTQRRNQRPPANASTRGAVIQASRCRGVTLDAALSLESLRDVQPN